MASYTSYINEVLAFLLPIAIYFLVLASLNRRAAPVLVSGLWDAFGLIFAASGFLLGTMPLILNDFYERAVLMQPDRVFFAIWLRHTLIWAVYFLMVLSGCALMLLARTRKTMIYNVDADLFRHVLAESFAPLGLDVTVNGRLVEVAPAPAALEGTGITAHLAAAAAAIPRHERFAELEIDSFPALCHVTLHWRRLTSSVREELEKELEKRLRNAAPVDNPAAGWCMTVSGLLFGAMAVLAVSGAVRSWSGG